MTDLDEMQLSKLAKRMLAMPPKKREDSKLGKARVKAETKANPRPMAKAKRSKG